MEFFFNVVINNTKKSYFYLGILQNAILRSNFLDIIFPSNKIIYKLDSEKLVLGLESSF